MGILFMETTDVNLDTNGFRCQSMDPSPFRNTATMGSPVDRYGETIHTIAINTRETDFGSIVEPIPITLKTYQQLQPNGCSTLNGFVFQPQQIAALSAVSILPQVDRPSTSTYIPNQNLLIKNEKKEDTGTVTRPPPKKRWIRDYLEEEPKSPVSVRLVSGVSVPQHSNGLVRATSPLVAAPCAPAAVPPAVSLEPVPAPTTLSSLPILDFAQEHSRPRSSSNSIGPPTIPSPPSVGSNGSSNSNSSGSASAPRPGTREVHNKLEKNRRAHLKECFELLKRQLPSTPDDKKTSNLSILHSAIRYIQVLRRKERECEHEMERLAREKIAAQQRLAALKRELSVRATVRPRSIDPVIEEKEKERDDRVNVQVLGIPISITSSSPQPVNQNATVSPPHTLNLSTKLRTLPIQITPTTSQVVRTSYGARHNTLTLTTLQEPAVQNGQPVENGVSNSLNTTTLVHPAQIHLPISQVVGSGGLVVSPAALQLLSTSSGLRVLQAPVHTNGVTTTENNRISRENGIVSSPPPSTENGSVVVSGLGPLVVSQPGTHLLQTHTVTHKLVETQVVKGSVAPLTVSAQYLSATTIVKPVVVVSAAGSAPPAPPT